MSLTNYLIGHLVPGVYPVYSKEKPSGVFAWNFCTEGSPAVDCELCGRNHFNSSGENMENRELEKCLENQKKDPKKYHAYDGEVKYGRIEGKQAVIGCPCNGLRQIEELIWRHRRLIMDYLLEMSQSNQKSANADYEAAQAASSAVQGT